MRAASHHVRAVLVRSAYRAVWYVVPCMGCSALSPPPLGDEILLLNPHAVSAPHRKNLSLCNPQQDDKILKELQEEKTKMELELKNLEASLKTAK